MTIEFNPTDRRLLNQRRLKRLRKLFLNPLGLCQLEFRRDRLAVHCPEPWIVDVLMEDWDYFIEMTRVILGAQLISVHYAGEEILNTSTQPMYPVAS
jgi:hypothetical protein